MPGILFWAFEVEFAYAPSKGIQRDWFETREEAQRAFDEWSLNGLEEGEIIRVIQVWLQEDTSYFEYPE